MSTTPADTAKIVCPKCNGDLWQLHGPAPPGTVEGQHLPVGNYAFNTVKCAVCDTGFTFDRVRLNL